VDVTAAAEPRELATLTVGGISRRGIGLMIAMIVILALIGVTAAWLANYEPLVSDGGVFAVRPLHAIVDQIEADAPNGTSFTQYRITVPNGGTFRYLFTVTNTAPMPVTISVDPHPVTWGPSIDGWWIDEQDGGRRPTTSAPYTVPSHGMAAVLIEGRMHGCLEPGDLTSFGTVPLTFTSFGVVERHTDVLLPISIQITGPKGTVCP
jgi:hypothetical protein